MYYPVFSTGQSDRFCSIKGVDFDVQTARFVKDDGKEMTERYDLLIAADGSNSVVRDELQKADPEFQVRQISAARTYKSIRSLAYPSEMSAFGL